VIQGGNHSQFGDYGLQPGDNEATITRADQQKQVVDATAQFLKELDQ
jgi:Alpha/beta hydrolase family